MWIYVALPLVAFFVISCTFWKFCLLTQEFDPVIWRDEVQIQKGVGLKMADQLIAQDKLHGLTRAEVVELLGEPPATQYFKDQDLVYRLGPERSFISIDSEWLVLHLDATGRVRDYRIVRD